MNVLETVISSLKEGEIIRDVRMGPFQTAVLSGRCALASTPVEDEYGKYQHHPAVREAGNLTGRPALEIAGLARSENPFESAIGMAAVNSLLPLDDRMTELNARDLLLEKGAGRKMAVIGHFPFVPELKKAASVLWVIEKRPRPGDLPEEAAETYLPEADVIGITGTTFLNHTIDRLLGLCRKGSFIVVMGGTAPLSPILFDYGVSAISGTMVTEPALVLAAVSQGATYRQLKGVRLLTLGR